jgi:hypothetical protein
MWPDTRGLPLEEVAAIFGDGDEVAIYQREIEIDHNTHTIIDHHAEDRMEKTRSSALESAAKDVPSESDHAKGHISHTEDADIDLSLDHVKKV